MNSIGRFNLNNMLPEAQYLTRIETESLNCNSVQNLANARFNNAIAEEDISVNSYEVNKIRASLSFAYAAMAGLTNMIYNLFFTVVYGVAALLDESFENGFSVQANHLWCDGLAVCIGAIGIVTPDTASEMFTGAMEGFIAEEFIDDNDSESFIPSQYSGEGTNSSTDHDVLNTEPGEGPDNEYEFVKKNNS